MPIACGMDAIRYPAQPRKTAPAGPPVTPARPPDFFRVTTNRS